MDLLKLIPTAQPLPVSLPNDEPTGIVLQVVGKESAQFFAASNKWTNHMQAMPAGRKATLEELAAMQADLLASLIVGWSGLTEGGQPLPYSHEVAVKLMSTPELQFLRDAVEDFASERSNFFRAIAPAATSSGPAVGPAKQPRRKRADKATAS